MKAGADGYPEQANELLGTLQEDPRLYSRMLCEASSDRSTVYRTPILAWIEPEKFVETVLQQAPSAQRIILESFRGRYQYGHLNGVLAEEVPWLRRVREALISEVAFRSRFSKHRIERFVKWYCDPFLKESGRDEAVGN